MPLRGGGPARSSHSRGKRRRIMGPGGPSEWGPRSNRGIDAVSGSAPSAKMISLARPNNTRRRWRTSS